MYYYFSRASLEIGTPVCEGVGEGYVRTTDSCSCCASCILGVQLIGGVFRNDVGRWG